MMMACGMVGRVRDLGGLRRCGPLSDLERAERREEFAKHRVLLVFSKVMVRHWWWAKYVSYYPLLVDTGELRSELGDFRPVVSGS